MHRLLFIIQFLFGAAYCLEIDGGVSYLGDNIGYIKSSYTGNLSMIPSPEKKVTVGVDYSHGRLKQQFSGFNTFTDDALTFSAGFNNKGKNILAGITVDYGMSLVGDMRRFVAFDVPCSFTMPGITPVTVLSTIQFRRGYADDSPMAQRIGVDKTDFSADVGIGIKGWEWHVSYQYAWYDAIKREDYEPLLSDTAFFHVFYDVLNPALSFISAQTDPIKANQQKKISAFFFGPVTSWMYMGATYRYRDAMNDTYIPLANNSAGNVIYTYFPYRAPHKEWGISGIVALSKSIDNARSPLNTFTFKVEVPIVSGGEYRGYYQIDPNMLLAGFEEFYYSCNGLKDMTISASVGKSVSKTFSVGIDYTWFSRPYAPYHFFGRDSYQYHLIGISLGKMF
jgi:hypothetical protein